MAPSQIVNLRKEEIQTGTILETRVDGKIAIIRAQSNRETPGHISFQILRKLGPVVGFGHHETAGVGLGGRVRRTAKVVGFWNPPDKLVE